MERAYSVVAPAARAGQRDGDWVIGHLHGELLYVTISLISPRTHT